MTTPTALEISLIEGVIAQAITLDTLNTPGAEAASRALKQLAIELVDRFYEIPQDHADGEPQYDPEVDGEGEATPEPGGKVQVKIGDDAFVFDGRPSAAWLASTKLHEICGHGEQVTAGGEWDPAVGDAESEVQAYNKELETAGDTGLTDDMIDEVKDRKKDHFDRMPEELQEEWTEREPWLAAFVPGGGGDVFVAGGLLDEVLGAFFVPEGTSVVDGAGRLMRLEARRSLRELSAELAEGDLGSFLALNPGLAVPASALRKVFHGPSASPSGPAGELPETVIVNESPQSTSEALATLLDALRIASGGRGSGPCPRTDSTAVLIPPSMSPGGVLTQG